MTPESDTRVLQILVVDDNEDDVILLEESLKDQSAVRLVHTARDGVEALAYLRRQGEFADAMRPALVLLDINMPRKNGFEVLSEMKEDPNLKSIPVVMLTTSHREADILNAYSIGACSFVSKPVNLDRLRMMAGHFVTYWSAVASIPQIEGRDAPADTSLEFGP
jgi:two-component system, chemotaxis family, response regulator Rcp1